MNSVSHMRGKREKNTQKKSLFMEKEGERDHSVDFKR